jgi:hypothetical protein
LIDAAARGHARHVVFETRVSRPLGAGLGLEGLGGVGGGGGAGEAGDPFPPPPPPHALKLVVSTIDAMSVKMRLVMFPISNRRIA